MRREDRNLSSHIDEHVDDPADILDMVDKSSGEWKEGVVEKLYSIACRCLEHSKKARPNVKDIQSELEAL
jgi:hypothetical protein